MTKFFYKAKDWNGKTIKGVLDSTDKTEAMESIKGGGLVLLSIAQENESLLNSLYKNLFSKIKIPSTIITFLGTTVTVLSSLW